MYTGWIMLVLICLAVLVIGGILIHHRVKHKGEPLDRDCKSFLIAYSCGLGTAYIAVLTIHFLIKVF